MFVSASLGGSALFAASRVAAAAESAPNRGEIELTAERRAAIVVECSQLTVAYGRAIDGADPAAFAATFAEEGTFEIFGKTYTGRGAIRGFLSDSFKNRKPNQIWRHQITNQQVLVHDASHATGSAYMAIYKIDPSVPATAESLSPIVLTMTHEHYVSTSEGWRTQHRFIELTAGPRPNPF